MSALLDRRLLFVTGKGGVGKSTVATALGLIGARRGRRTIVVELGAQDRMQRTFDHSAEQYGEIELADGLFTISVDPQHAMEEYLRLKAGPMGGLLSGSRLFQAFAMATPGLRELLSIGKIWELAQFERRTHGALPYDLVIVDAPATGHGIGILRTPRTFADIARVGPIAHQGRQIAETIADRDFTALVAVSTPEEMPVNETLILRDAVHRERLELDLVVLNALYPARFSPEQAQALQSASATIAGDGASVERTAVRAALSEDARARRQREQLARLADGLGSAPVELPFLFVEQLGLHELGRLADVLEPAV